MLLPFIHTVPEQVIQVYPSKCCIIITANAGYGHLGALVLACSEYRGLGINIRWVPLSEDNQLLGLAKEQARAATPEDAHPKYRSPAWGQ